MSIFKRFKTDYEYWWTTTGQFQFQKHRDEIGRVINSTRGLSHAAIEYLRYQYPLWDKNEKEWKKRFDNEPLVSECEFLTCLGLELEE